MNLEKIKEVIKQDYLSIVSVVITIIAVSLVMQIGQAISGAPTRSFFYSKNGNLVPAIVTPNPRYNDQKVIRFVHRVVSKCLSIDYPTVKKISNQDNKNDYFTCVNKYFAPFAASSLYQNYPTDSHIQSVLESQAVTYAILPFKPLIIARNKPTEALRWVINVPITFTIQSVSTSETTSMSANLEVIPSIEANNPSELLITKAEFQ